MSRTTLSLILALAFACVGFTSGGGGSGGGGSAGGIGANATNACGTDGQCSAANFGGGLLNDAAIQLAWNYAQGVDAHYVPPTYVPAGTYNTTYPVVLINSNVSGLFGDLIGAGGNPHSATYGATIIKPAGPFPGIISIPNNYLSGLGTVAASALVGAGNSLQFNSAKPYFLNLSEVPLRSTTALSAQPLDGLPTVTFQGYFKTPAANSTVEGLMGSSTSANAVGALDLIFTVNGNFTAKLNTGGSVTTLAAGTVATNTTYWFALSYTGANLYLYLAVPGTAGVSPIASSVATGNVTQVIAETLAVGGDKVGFPPFASTNPFVGQVDSIDIESNAVYSGGAVTAPNAKFSKTANTLYLNNFTTITPTTNAVVSPIVSVDALHGSTQADAWQFLWNATFGGNARGPTIRGVDVIGGTIGTLLAQTPLTDLHDVAVQNNTYAGLEGYNNIFFSTFENMTSDGAGVSGYLFSWSFNSGINLAESGAPYGVVCGQIGCGLMVGTTISPGSNALASIYQVNANTTFDHDAFVDAIIDNEAVNNAPALQTGSTNAGAINIVGGEWIGGGTASAIQCDLHCDITMLGGQLWPSASSSNVINFASTATPSNVKLVGVTLENNAITPSNHPEYLMSPACGGPVTLSTGTGTFTSRCVNTASVCEAADLTTRSNVVTLGNPADGSVAITGTGSDVVKVVCQ